MTSNDLRTLADKCRYKAKEISHGQYKNGTYSKFSGDTAELHFTLMAKELDAYANELFEQEIKMKMLEKIYPDIVIMFKTDI